MMVRSLLTTTLTVLLFSAAPAVSMAQSCEAPPGSSAVEQYCEAIPEGGGSQSSDDFNRSSGNGAAAGTTSGGGDGGTGGQTPSPAAKELQAAGADGKAVSGLAKSSTAPAKLATPSGAVAGESAASSEPSGSPLKAVSASVENGSTVGSGLIWGLLAVTLVIATLGWVAYRRHDDGTATRAASPQSDPS